MRTAQFLTVIVPGQLLGSHFFRVPTKEDEYSTNWRNNIVAVITRDRVIDGNLKRQIENRTPHTCELHHPQEKMIRRK